MHGKTAATLLSDNGSSYISENIADWLDEQGMKHLRGAPYHPESQGKMERWHQTLKNRILLENYYLPGALDAQSAGFVDHYNYRRPDVSRRRAQWHTYQGLIDPSRLVFIDET